MSLDLSAALQKNPEERLRFLIAEAVKNQKIWLLCDEYGAVMLNTDDEDCVPVWPDEAYAIQWATQEWENCKPEAITIDKWFSHWSNGLAEDNLALVIFPDLANEGIVLDPDEFESLLRKKIAKQSR